MASDEDAPLKAGRSAHIKRKSIVISDEEDPKPTKNKGKANGWYLSFSSVQIVLTGSKARPTKRRKTTDADDDFIAPSDEEEEEDDSPLVFDETSPAKKTKTISKSSSALVLSSEEEDIIPVKKKAGKPRLSNASSAGSVAGAGGMMDSGGIMTAAERRAAAAKIEKSEKEKPYEFLETVRDVSLLWIIFITLQLLTSVSSERRDISRRRRVRPTYIVHPQERVENVHTL